MAGIVSCAALAAASLALCSCSKGARWVRLGDGFIARYQRGDYAGALRAADQALALAESAFGAETPKVVIALNRRSLALQGLGRNAEAAEASARAVALASVALGPEHPDLAYSLANQAMALFGSKRLAEAEAANRKALAIYERAAPEYAVKAGTAWNGLAMICQEQKKHAEAEAAYKQALAVFEKELGPGHPFIPAILENMAKLYKAMGRQTEAASCEQRLKSLRGGKRR